MDDAKFRILCVIPSHDEALGLLGVFSEDGYDVTWVPGPREAIGQVRSNAFDVILADLPRRDACARTFVESAKPAAGWVVVNGTARRVPHEALRVDRPLDPDQVRDAVRRTLGRPDLLSRFEPSPGEPPRWIDLRDLLVDACALLAPAETRIEPGPPVRLFARPAHLRYSLLTLLLNASQAVPKRGRLQVDARREGMTARVRICDPGFGTPRAILDRGRMRRALEIVVEHHGRLTAYDRAGIGSVTEIEMPVLT